MSLKNKEYSSAITFFDKAIKANPKKVEALLYKGITLMDANNLAEAISVLLNI